MRLLARSRSVVLFGLTCVAGLVALGALVPGPAAADDPHCGGAASVVQHIFDAADQNHDGALTPKEYEDAGLARYGVSFEETDANGDGVTTMAEYLELYARHHAHPHDHPPQDEKAPANDNTV